jgi:hypothetical protein
MSSVWSGVRFDMSEYYTSVLFWNAQVSLLKTPKIKVVYWYSKYKAKGMSWQ